jgi:hypothetical protein
MFLSTRSMIRSTGQIIARSRRLLTWKSQTMLPTSIIVQKCSLECDPRAGCSNVTGSTSVW